MDQTKTPEQLHQNAGNNRKSYTQGHRPSIFVEAAIVVASYMCALCEHVLRCPCQVKCGHQFCESCLQRKLEDHSSCGLLCPTCLEEYEEVPITQANVQPDYALRRQMGKLAVYCERRVEGCEWYGCLGDLEEHLKRCDHAPVKCTHCRDLVAPKRMEEHQEFCPGLDQDSPCVFGCRDLPSDADLAHHYEECLSHHVDVVWQLMQMLQRLRGKMNTLSERASVLATQAPSGSTSTVLASGAGVSGDGVGEEDVSRAGRDVTMVDDVKKNLEKMDVATKTSTTLINVAFKEVQTIAARLINLERWFQREMIGDSTSESPSRVLEIDQLRDQAIGRGVSYNGILLWEITGFKDKFESAKNGTGTSINSQVFYSSQCGYKLMARIYLHGDERGEASHISLFVVVQKGEFDAVQKWPMKELIRFTLLDQSGNLKHHMYTFRTDPSSPSFSRPVRAANIASGCPLFLSLDDFVRSFDHFVQDDTMMLEVRLMSHQNSN